MSKHFTKEEFEQSVPAASVAMVDFWAEWCGPCKMIGPVIDQIAEQYEGKALVGKVNVDNEPELAQRFGVMTIPTVIFFKNGEEIDRKIGLQAAEIYTQLLDSNLG